MSKAIVLTVDQAKTLKHLYINGAVTATDFDRSFLEQLVRKGMARKGYNGSFVSYSISAYGKLVRESL